MASAAGNATSSNNNDDVDCNVGGDGVFEFDNVNDNIGGTFNNTVDISSGFSFDDENGGGKMVAYNAYDNNVDISGGFNFDDYDNSDIGNLENIVWDNDFLVGLSTDFDYDIDPVMDTNNGRVISTTTVIDEQEWPEYDHKIDHKMNDYIKRREYQFDLSIHEMTAALRAILRIPNANFRGNQYITLKTIFKCEYSCILQICGTGIGKSMTFMLTARLSNGGLTVVIVPFVALQSDLITSALAAGINAMIWDTSIEWDTENIPELLFISPESFTKSGFRRYLDNVVIEHRLDRFVFDETHTILE